MQKSEEQIKFVAPNIQASRGSAGLRTQAYGMATTITAAAEAIGGLRKGTLFMNNQYN